MSVKSYNFAPNSADAANWAVAGRMVSAFAPQAQSSPDMTIFLNKGWLLVDAAMIETSPQTVGPFAVPATSRIDRVVVSRSTGVASIVAGTEGALTPPALPAGCLPVARVALAAGMAEITNDALTDERVFADQTLELSANLTALSALDGSAGLLEQTGPATFTKRALGTAAAAAVPTRADADGRYLQLTGGSLTGALTLAGDPAAALQAAPKQYVDQEISAAVAAITPASIGAASSSVTVTGSGVLTGGGDLTADRVITAADVAQNTLLGRTAAGTGAPSALSAPMVGVVAAADAAASRAVLGLGDAALRTVGTAAAADLPSRGDADGRYLQLSGGTLTGAVTLAGDPTAALQPASKQYVDNLAAGLDVKASVKAAGVGDLTLSGEQNVDGAALVAGDRVLVKNQAAAAENGVYVVAAGAWSRAADMDAWGELPGAFVFVERGSVNADSGWVCAADAGGTLGTDPVLWSQFAGVGAFAPLARQILAGTGLTGGGDLSADRTLALADTAVTAGSYGSAANVATFTVDGQGRLTAAAEAAITPAAIGAQPQDADLDALAGVSGAGLLARTGAGTAAARSVQGAGVVSVANGDAVAGDPTVSLTLDSGRLLGRSTAGSGAAEQITLGAGLLLSGGELTATATGAEITQSGPTYLASGGATTLTAKTVLAAYEQTAGETFNVNYNTESGYAQQDAANGTDLSSGGFALHNTAGASIDGATRLLLHADGPNGSTEIVDNRGITPFGTGCAYFDGTAYFQVPQSSKLAFRAWQDFTFEGWFRADRLVSGDNTFMFDCRGAGVVAPIVYVTSTGKLRYQTTDTPRITGATTIVTDVWHHVALVRSGGTTTLYLNGVSEGSFLDGFDYASAEIVIGNGYAGGAYGWGGWIDEFRVSKVARYTANFTLHTEALVRDADTVYLFHFDDGHGSMLIRDDSRSGQEVALNGNLGLSSTASKFGPTSVRAASADGCVQVAGGKAHGDFVLGSDDFTVDFWVNPDSVSSAQNLVAFGQPGSAQYGLQVQINAGGALALYASTNGSSFDAANGVVGGSIAAGSFSHVAVTRSGTALKVFLNGVAVISVTLAGGANLFTSVSGQARFGRTIAGNLSLVGYFDEIRIKRGVAEWTADFTPPTAPYATDDRTILLLHFDGANGDKVTLDSSESSYGTAQIFEGVIPALKFNGTLALSAGQTRGGHTTSLGPLASGNIAVFTLNDGDFPLGSPFALAQASSYFCLDGWFYEANSTTGTVAGIYEVSGGWSRFKLNKQSATTLECTVMYTQSNAFTITAGTTASGWNHFAVVKEPRGWVLYINGMATASPVYPERNLYLNQAYNHTLNIGAYREYNSEGILSGAYIDSVRITNGKPRYTANFTPGNLTQDDDTALLWVFDGSVGQKWVKELSKNTAMIASANARTVSDGAWIAPSASPAILSNAVAAKFGSNSFSFGESYYITVPHSGIGAAFSGGAWTVDCWANFNDTSTLRCLAAKGASAGANITFYLERRPDNTIRGTVYNTGGAVFYAATTSTVTTSVWVHVAFVFDGANIKIFLNGVLEATTAFTGTLATNANFMTIGSYYDGTSHSEIMYGRIDELRVSDTARWTANFTAPTIPYGQQYVSGPFWVATKPGASSLDLSAFSSIDSAALTAVTPPGTTLKFLISTDGYASALKRWNGAAWIDSGYSMTWDGSSLTTSATSAQLDSVGNSGAELQTGLTTLDAATLSSLNIVALLATSNAGFTPALDNLAVTMDEYSLLRPVTDYTVSRKKVSGEQSLTVTRVKSGAANHVFDVV